MSEGLPQPFTTLHYPSLVRKSDIRSPSASQSFYRFSFFLSLTTFLRNSLVILSVCPEKIHRWRVVKGSEGLKQPFTLIFSCDSTTYTVKVKSEGLSQIFFGVHRLISKNQQKHAEEIQRPFISSSTNSHSKVRKMRRQGIFPYALSLVPLRYR